MQDSANRQRPVILRKSQIRTGTLLLNKAITPSFIVNYLDQIDKLIAIDGQRRSVSGEGVQHALLKIMEGAAVKLVDGHYIDTTNILFICGGAFVGLDDIMAQSNAYRYISIQKGESQKML